MSEDAKELMVNLLGMLFLIIFIVILFFGVQWINSVQCSGKWQSFESKYSYVDGCQIKVIDKWIPAESYYFKEE